MDVGSRWKESADAASATSRAGKATVRGMAPMARSAHRSPSVPFLPKAMSRVSRWIRLQLALSGLALLVVLVRSGQLAHAAGTPGVHVVWGPILATQAAFWITWSV